MQIICKRNILIEKRKTSSFLVKIKYFSDYTYSLFSNRWWYQPHKPINGVEGKDIEGGKLFEVIDTDEDYFKVVEEHDALRARCIMKIHCNIVSKKK